ncbi:hypothetical protein, partial [Cellvibrio sp.]
CRFSPAFCKPYLTPTSFLPYRSFRNTAHIMVIYATTTLSAQSRYWHYLLKMLHLKKGSGATGTTRSWMTSTTTR